METVYLDYAPKGVKFYYLYKALAHPGLNGYVQPFTLKERLLQVREAERKLGSKIPWLCDNMDNDAKHALGNRPNAEFVIDPQGRLVRMRSWSNPAALRRDLAELVGAVNPPTRVEDLDLKRFVATPPTNAVRGVVPPVKLPGRLIAVRIVPQSGPEPFYVKLRAAVEPAVLETGAGKLLLGFHLDPLYAVHWNNLVAPLEYTVEFSGAGRATPATGKGPKVNAAADLDPREFLVDLNAVDARQPLAVTVRYFACNDREGFCKAITQKYQVILERDPDAGNPIRPRP